MDAFIGWLLIILTAYGIWLSVIILNKAGYSGWWALTLFIPIVNIIMLFVFAYHADWPRLKKKL